jgi:hypothetical protein
VASVRVDVAGASPWPAEPTTLVSAPDHGSQGDNYSFEPTLSQSGATSGSARSRPTWSGDTNGVADTFVRDLRGGGIERLSLAADGSQGNGATNQPAIAPDGRHEGFRTDTPATTNVFVRRL